MAPEVGEGLISSPNDELKKIYNKSIQASSTIIEAVLTTRIGSPCTMVTLCMV